MRPLLLLLCCAPPLAAADLLDPAALREDFQIARQALAEAHPGIYRYTPKPELDRVFDQAAAGLNRPMTALEFYRILSPAVAAMKCGHTTLEVSAEMQKAMGDSVPLLPLEVRVLNYEHARRIYVFRDYSDKGQLAGAELRSINNVAAGRIILETMLASIHGDGDTPTAGPWRIGRGHAFAESLYALAGLEDPFRIRYSLGGQKSETALNGMPASKISAVARSRLLQDGRPSGNATYKVLNGGAVGVLKIYGFGGQAVDGTPLDRFFQNVYNDLRIRRTPNLILDVRDNGGGADELGKQLFSYQANGEYRLVAHPNWGTEQPGQPHFGGKVFALMNGGSFSTTCEFLSTLHHHHRATFIGEEAAGGYYGNTSGPGALLVLPNSRLRLPVRFMTYYMAIAGAEFGKHSIAPDKPVQYTIGELLSGVDKEMDFALRLIAGE